MQGKTVKDSALVVTQVMSPQDANIAGNVHGGVVMRLIDTTAAVVAMRHARANIVTASVDRLDFLNPIFVGDLVTFRASLNMVGRTSMEVGVRVESENLVTGKLRHTASAYLTMVALDKDKHPAQVPPLILETTDERRRNRQAQARRQLRLAEKATEK